MKALNRTIVESFAKIESTTRQEMAKLRSQIAAYTAKYGVAETCNAVNLAIDSWRQIGVKGTKLQQRVRRLERALNAAGVLKKNKYFKIIKGKTTIVLGEDGYRLNRAGNVVKSRQTTQNTTQDTPDTTPDTPDTTQDTPDTTQDTPDTDEQPTPDTTQDTPDTDEQPTKEELLKKIEQLQTALNSALQIIDLQEAELEAYHKYASRTATKKAESAVNQRIEAM